MSAAVINQAVSHSVKRPDVRSGVSGAGLPFPLNNGTHLTAPKKYVLDSAKMAPIYREVELPLSPPGQKDIALNNAADVQALKLPKQSYQKAFSCGDHFEISEYFDEKLEPLMFLYDYNKKSQFEAPGNLETDAERQERIRQELLAEGWPPEKIAEMIEEPEEETEEEPGEENACEISEETRARSLRRAKQNARLCIQAARFDMMWTFTFALPRTFAEVIEADRKYLGITRYLSVEEQRDRKAVNKAWDSFQKRLRRYCKKENIELRWLKVLELHDGEETSQYKKGTYHIHLATDLRINKSTLQRLWGYGIVHFTDFSKELYSEQDRENNGPEDKTLTTNYCQDPSFYMTKYIDKDFDEARENKEKAFSKSQNVKTPKPSRDHFLIEEKRIDPLKAFELVGMAKEVSQALRSAKMEDLLLSSNLYPIEFQKWNPDAQDFVTVKGFVRKSYYSAWLALPKYKARHEKFLEKKRKKAEADCQLALF